MISDISQQRFGVGVIGESLSEISKVLCFGLTDCKKSAVEFLAIAARNNVLPSNFGEVAEDWFC